MIHSCFVVQIDAHDHRSACLPAFYPESIAATEFINTARSININDYLAGPFLRFLGGIGQDMAARALIRVAKKKD